MHIAPVPIIDYEALWRAAPSSTTPALKARPGYPKVVGESIAAAAAVAILPWCGRVEVQCLPSIKMPLAWTKCMAHSSGGPRSPG